MQRDGGHAARLALLLAVCHMPVIPKQALSVRRLLIHWPRGGKAQVAALTANIFPKIPAAASHLHPYLCIHTHAHARRQSPLCYRYLFLIELTSSHNLLMLHVKRKLQRCPSPLECELSLVFRRGRASEGEEGSPVAMIVRNSFVMQPYGVR